MFVRMGAGAVERLVDGLGYSRVSASVSTALVGGEPVLRFRRGSMNARRVHVELVLLGGERAIDVSFHPAAASDVVRGHARQHPRPGCPPRPPRQHRGHVLHPAQRHAGVLAVYREKPPPAK